MASNESAAVAAAKMFAEAQERYRRTDWDGDGVLEYAQTLSGPRGLGTVEADPALISDELAKAEGMPGVAEPSRGYVYKVLKAQGPAAPGGAKEYLVNGKLTGGYALVACPASYDGTGRNMFMVNPNGSIYQKDFGPKTEETFNAMSTFNPDTGWVVSE